MSTADEMRLIAGAKNGDPGSFEQLVECYMGRGIQVTMAYVDDELSADERAEFEQRMAQDPELAAEVAGHHSLIHLTHAMATLEPGDHEVRRFWAHFYNRSE